MWELSGSNYQKSHNAEFFLFFSFFVSNLFKKFKISVVYENLDQNQIR